MKYIFLILTCVCLACAQSTVTRMSDREHDGFAGPVKKVFEEWSPISGGHVPAGSRCRQMTNVYDESGRLMQHSVYPGSCGSDEIREDYTYAADGSQTTKTLMIRGKNSPPPPPPVAPPPGSKEEPGEPRTVFKYDTSGRLVEEASVEPGGQVGYKTTYSYDDKGRMMEMASSDRDGPILARRVYSYSGDKRVPSRYIYYGRGNRIYETITYTDYEFNSHGDWIKRKGTIKEDNNQSVLISFRTIEYYPNGK